MKSQTLSFERKVMPTIPEAQTGFMNPKRVEKLGWKTESTRGGAFPQKLEDNKKERRERQNERKRGEKKRRGEKSENREEKPKRGGGRAREGVTRNIVWGKRVQKGGATWQNARVEAILESLERTPARTREDGHCLYLSVGKQIIRGMGMQLTNWEVNSWFRKSVRDAMWEHRHSVHREESVENGRKRIEKGIDKQRVDSGGWGGDWEAEIMAKVYGVRLRILNAHSYDEEHDRWLGDWDDETTPLVTVVYHNSHFWETIGNLEGEDFEIGPSKEPKHCQNQDPEKGGKEKGREEEKSDDKNKNKKRDNEKREEERKKKEKEREEENRKKNEKEKKEKRERGEKASSKPEGEEDKIPAPQKPDGNIKGEERRTFWQEKKEEKRERAKKNGKGQTAKKREKAKKTRKKKRKEKRDEKANKAGESQRGNRKEKKKVREEKERKRREKGKGEKKKKKRGKGPKGPTEKKEKKRDNILDVEEGVILFTSQKCKTEGLAGAFWEKHKELELKNPEMGIKTTWVNKKKVVIQAIEEEKNPIQALRRNLKKVLRELDSIRKNPATGVWSEKTLHLPAGLGKRGCKIDKDAAEEATKAFCQEAWRQGWTVKKWIYRPQKPTSAKEGRGAGFHKEHWKIYSHNINSMAGREEDFVRDLRKAKIDIACAQETKTHRGVRKVGEYNMYSTQPKTTKTKRGQGKSGGVTTAVHQSIVVKGYSIDERNLGWVTVGDLKIVNFYGPQATTERMHVKAQWESLEENLEQYKTVICCDANAKQIRPNYDAEGGKHPDENPRVGRGEFNERGNANTPVMDEVMKENNLYALCTFRQTKEGYKENWTYSSAKGTIKSKPDYILGTGDVKERVRRVEVGGPKAGSQLEGDHRPIVIKIGKKSKQAPKGKKGERNPLEKDYNPDIVRELASSLGALDRQEEKEKKEREEEEKKKKELWEKLKGAAMVRLESAETCLNHARRGGEKEDLKYAREAYGRDANRLQKQLEEEYERLLNEREERKTKKKREEAEKRPPWWAKEENGEEIEVDERRTFRLGERIVMDLDPETQFPKREWRYGEDLINAIPAWEVKLREREKLPERGIIYQKAENGIEWETLGGASVRETLENECSDEQFNEKPDWMTEEEHGKVKKWGRKRLAKAIEEARRQQDKKRGPFFKFLFKNKRKGEGWRNLKKEIQAIREKTEELGKKFLELGTAELRENPAEWGSEKKEKILSLKREYKRLERKWTWRRNQAQGPDQVKLVRKEHEEFQLRKGKSWREWVEMAPDYKNWSQMAQWITRGLEIIAPKMKKPTQIWRGDTDVERDLQAFLHQAENKVVKLRETQGKSKEREEDGEREHWEAQVKERKEALADAKKKGDEDYWEEEIRRAMARPTNPSRELFNILKRMTANETKRRPPQGTNFKEGSETITDPQEAANLFREVIRSKFREQNPEDEDTDEKWGKMKERAKKGDITVEGRRLTDEVAETLKRAPLLERYIAAIRRLKTNKAAGVDRIIGEVFKTHPKYFAALLQKLEQGAIEELADGWVAYIYKNKGLRSQKMMYRPVTVLNVCYKVITSVYTHDLNKVTGALNMRKYGFLPKTGTRDYLHAVKMILTSHTGKNMSVALMDMSLAFDRARRTQIWEAMIALGAPIDFVDRIRKLFRVTTMRAFWGGKLAEGVETTMGVFQGCPISPQLFIICMELLNRKVDRTCSEGELVGLRLAKDTTGPTYRPLSYWMGGNKAEKEGEEAREMAEEWHVTAYADDTVIWAPEGMEQLVEKIKIFQKLATEEANMLVNREKTEILTREKMSESERQSWAKDHLGKEHPNGTEIAFSARLVGGEIHINGRTKAMIDYIVEKAVVRQRKVTHQLVRAKAISLKTKLQMMEAMLDSVIMFGTDSTEPSHYDYERLNRIQKKSLLEIVRRERKSILKERIQESLKNAGCKGEGGEKEGKNEELQEELKQVKILWESQNGEEIKKIDVPTVISKCKKGRLGLLIDTHTKLGLGKWLHHETKWEGQTPKKPDKKQLEVTGKIWDLWLDRLDIFERIMTGDPTCIGEEIREVQKEFEKRDGIPETDSEEEREEEGINGMREQQKPNWRRVDRMDALKGLCIPSIGTDKARTIRKIIEKGVGEELPEEGARMKLWQNLSRQVRNTQGMKPRVKSEEEILDQKYRLLKFYGAKHATRILGAIQKVRDSQLREEDAGATLEQWLRARENIGGEGIVKELMYAILDTSRKEDKGTFQCPYCRRNFHTPEARGIHWKNNLDAKDAQEQRLKAVLQALTQAKGEAAREKRKELKEELKECQDANCVRRIIEWKRDEDASYWTDMGWEQNPYETDDEGNVRISKECCVATKSCKGSDGPEKCAVCAERWGNTLARRRKAFRQKASKAKAELYTKISGGKILRDQVEMPSLQGCFHPGQGEPECEFPRNLCWTTGKGEVRYLRSWETTQGGGNTYWCKKCCEKLEWENVPDRSTAERRYRGWLMDMRLQGKKGKIEDEKKAKREELGANWRENPNQYKPLTKAQLKGVEEFDELARGLFFKESMPGKEADSGKRPGEREEEEERKKRKKSPPGGTGKEGKTPDPAEREKKKRRVKKKRERSRSQESDELVNGQAPKGGNSQGDTLDQPGGWSLLGPMPEWNKKRRKRESEKKEGESSKKGNRPKNPKSPEREGQKGKGKGKKNPTTPENGRRGKIRVSPELTLTELQYGRQSWGEKTRWITPLQGEVRVPPNLTLTELQCGRQPGGEKTQWKTPEREREKEQKRTGSPLQSLQPGMKRKKRELERAGRQGAITPRELELKPTQD